MKPARLFVLAAVAVSLVVGAAVPAPAPVPAEDAKTELAKLAGTWKVVSFKKAGVETIDEKEPRNMIIRFKKDGSFEWSEDARGSGQIAHIDPSKKPKEIEYTYDSEELKGKTEKGIYKLDGDTFTDCFAKPGEARPTEFKSTKQNGYTLVVYKRVKRKD